MFDTYRFYAEAFLPHLCFRGRRPLAAGRPFGQCQVAPCYRVRAFLFRGRLQQTITSFLGVFVAFRVRVRAVRPVGLFGFGLVHDVCLPVAAVVGRHVITVTAVCPQHLCFAVLRAWFCYACGVVECSRRSVRIWLGCVAAPLCTTCSLLHLRML